MPGPRADTEFIGAHERETGKAAALEQAGREMRGPSGAASRRCGQLWFPLTVIAVNG
jgi:hypothetical protein